MTGIMDWNPFQLLWQVEKTITRRRKNKAGDIVIVVRQRIWGPPIPEREIGWAAIQNRQR
jgi:hypothetical protein